MPLSIPFQLLTLTLLLLVLSRMYINIIYCTSFCASCAGCDKHYYSYMFQFKTKVPAWINFPDTLSQWSRVKKKEYQTHWNWLSDDEAWFFFSMLFSHRRIFGIFWGYTPVTPLLSCSSYQPRACRSSGNTALSVSLEKKQWDLPVSHKFIWEHLVLMQV